MKQMIIACLLLVSFTTVHAQEFEITGQVKDANANPVESATVYLETVQDSTLITYTITNEEGMFSLGGKTKQKNAKLHVSYTGMKPIEKLLTLDSPKIDLQSLTLEEQSETLNEVLVIANRAPIQVKKDTLQFNANSFKTSSDANVETLLKKLPGVEVDKDGNITVNGKKVSKILVNGKEFFGNDPKIATKNLPKEIIDQIQVVDKKTKDQEFTGEDGDKEEKMINLTIKEDKNKGFFGRLTGGYGTNDRYQTSGILNYFNNDERMSLLGGSNNVNTSGFNSDEVQDMGGGNYNYIQSNGVWIQANPLLGNYNDGITQTTSAGIHYANDWEEKASVTTDYFFNQKETRTAAKIESETFLPTQSFKTSQNDTSDGLSNDHNFNFDFEINPDTLTRISIQPLIRKSYGDRFSSSDRSSRNSSNNLINQSTATNNDTFDNLNSQLELSFSRRLKQKGEYFRLWVDANSENNKSDNRFNSAINYFDGGVTPNESINQLQQDRTKSFGLNLHSTYRKKIKNNWFYSIGADLEQRSNKRDRKVFDFNTISQDYTTINTSFTNDYKTNSTQFTPTVGLSYRKDKFRVSLTGGYNIISLKNEDLLAQNELKSSFKNPNIRLHFWKQFAPGKSIWSYYSYNRNVPAFQQLQPIQDNSNPLNLVVGNPNLEASTSNYLNLSYNNFNMKTQRNFGIRLGASFTDDVVVSNTITDPTTLKRVTTYKNVDGFYWLTSNVNFNKKYKWDKHNFSWGLRANYNFNQSKGFSNTVLYTTKTQRITPSVEFTYNYDDLIEFTPGLNYNYNIADYSIDLGQEANFSNTSISARLETFWPKRIEFSNDFNLIYNPNVGEGFTTTAYMWNASVGLKMFKDKGLLKLKVFDLLNQNTSVLRTTSQDYIQDRESLVLEQYFMLSFTYKVNKFTGQKK